MTFLVCGEFTVEFEIEDTGLDMDPNAIERIKESIKWFYECETEEILYVGESEDGISKEAQKRMWDEYKEETGQERG